MNEYNEGDLLEAVKGESVIRGYVDSDLDIVTENVTHTPSFLLRRGWAVAVIKRATPPLPTEPGWYLDRQDDIWRLLESGIWRCPISDNDSVRPEAYAPFTRLESVPETATRVLERVASFWEFGPPTAVSGELDEIAAEFGVTP